jgi:hypothetical protein
MALVVLGHFGGYLGQRLARPLEQVGGAVLPPALAEHAQQARSYVFIGCRAQAGQFLVQAISRPLSP